MVLWCCVLAVERKGYFPWLGVTVSFLLLYRHRDTGSRMSQTSMAGNRRRTGLCCLSGLSVAPGTCRRGQPSEMMTENTLHTHYKNGHYESVKYS